MAQADPIGPAEGLSPGEVPRELIGLDSGTRRLLPEAGTACSASGRCYQSGSRAGSPQRARTTEPAAIAIRLTMDTYGVQALG